SPLTALSLHDALPISRLGAAATAIDSDSVRGGELAASQRALPFSLAAGRTSGGAGRGRRSRRSLSRGPCLDHVLVRSSGISRPRSEEHTSELQSPCNL